MSGRDRSSRRDQPEERQPVRREGSRHGYRAKDYGSWDGTKESIPGDITRDNTPDMRDARNREAFLGESEEERRERTARQIQGQSTEGGRRDRTRRREPEDRSRRTESRRDQSDRSQGGGSDQPQRATMDDLDSVLNDLEDIIEDADDNDLLSVAEDLYKIQGNLLSEIGRRDRPRS
jgi:hypothetical protein